MDSTVGDFLVELFGALIDAVVPRGVENAGVTFSMFIASLVFAGLAALTVYLVVMQRAAPVAALAALPLVALPAYALKFGMKGLRGTNTSRRSKK